MAALVLIEKVVNGKSMIFAVQKTFTEALLASDTNSMSSF